MSRIICGTQFEPQNAPIFTPTPSPTSIPQRAEWATQTAVALQAEGQTPTEIPAAGTPVAGGGSPISGQATPIGSPVAGTPVGSPLAGTPVANASPSGAASPVMVGKPDLVGRDSRGRTGHPGGFTDGFASRLARQIRRRRSLRNPLRPRPRLRIQPRRSRRPRQVTTTTRTLYSTSRICRMTTTSI